MTDGERAAAKRRGHELFDPLAEPYLALPGVDIGRMFGSEGLRVRGRIFAFLGFDGDLVAKVPEAHADRLTASGPGRRMVMRGREMREWVVYAQAEADAWPAVIAEAYAFVDALTPGDDEAGTESSGEGGGPPR